MTQSTYVIPDHMSRFSQGKPFLLLLVTAGLGLLFFGVEGAIGGFFAGIPLVIVTALVRGVLLMRKLKAVWHKHTYAWYRETFPEHAHEKGRVSCRHCGGTKVVVRNLMNHTFMRSHSCAQCGETLYFSPEKV